MEETIPAALALRMVRTLINIPFAKVCKHTIMLDLLELSDLDTESYDQLVKAIVRADDNAALIHVNAMMKE